MNSRERVRAVLDRKKPDRIPFGLGGCETAGFHILAYEKFKEAVGLKSPKNRMYTFMTNAVAEPEFLEAAGGDIIVLNSKLCSVPLWGVPAENKWKETEFWGKKFQVPSDWNFTTKNDGTIYWDNFNWSCKPSSIYFDPEPENEIGMVDTDELNPDDYNPPHELPDEYLRNLEKSAEWLYNNTDYAIACGETITDLQVQPGGQVAWWMLMAEDADRAHEYLRKSCDAGIAHIKQLDQAIGKYVDIMGIAHDFGDGRGVTIGPRMWREIYKPHYKRLFTEWRKITNMKVNLHSCGAISDIIGDLIECGLQILNPVQVSADGMDPVELKRKFGDSLIFLGGSYDSISNPIERSYEEVYQTVKTNIEALSKGGGYIFAGVHNIPGNIPQHHVKAVLDAYYACRNNKELL